MGYNCKRIPLRILTAVGFKRNLGQEKTLSKCLGQTAGGCGQPHPGVAFRVLTAVGGEAVVRAEGLGPEGVTLRRGGVRPAGQVAHVVVNAHTAWGLHTDPIYKQGIHSKDKEYRFYRREYTLNIGNTDPTGENTPCRGVPLNTNMDSPNSR